MEGNRGTSITRVKWGQEVNDDEFEEVSIVNPQAHQNYYTQDSLFNRRAKSGGGRFTGIH